MARDIYSCLRLTGSLVTQSPLHVGSCGDDVDTDLPLARDGAGQLYIPGTSLAGALRELAEQLFGFGFIETLWGYQKDDKGHASFVAIDDAAIENAEQVIVEVRDGVGIDRQWGAAAEHIKYDRAILPRGTRMTLNLTVDVENRNRRTEALAMTAALKEVLEKGQVRLGAAKTRGLGQVKLEGGTITEQIYSTRQGILGLLRNNSGSAVTNEDIAKARESHSTQPRPRLTITIHWKPVGPLMVKAGFDGIAADMLPLTSGMDGEIALVLPGSSVKGAFRSQAERIVRTILGMIDLPWLEKRDETKNPRQKCLDAVEVPLINELFGKRGVKIDKDDKSSWLQGLGALSVTDCYAQHRMTQQQWQDIQAATKDTDLRRALDAADLEPWAQAYHVAIDRWLSSAAESMLYTVLEPHCTEWEPLTLEVHLRRLPDALRLPGVALLFLVIRDLAQGRLPLGFATHRGMGTVRVVRVEVEGEDLPQELQALGNLTLANGQLTELPSSLRQAMNQAWQQWIEQKRQEVTS